jgi:hypothetical protein
VARSIVAKLNILEPISLIAYDGFIFVLAAVAFLAAMLLSAGVVALLVRHGRTRVESGGRRRLSRSPWSRPCCSATTATSLLVSAAAARGDCRVRVIRWPWLAALIGAVAWAPGFSLADSSRGYPFDRTLLPYIAAFCAAWALLTATLIRARCAYKRSKQFTAESAGDAE